MTPPPYNDDSQIADDEWLLRRIPTTWVQWDAEGNPGISSAAFKDEELSVYLESVMVRDGRPPNEAIEKYPGYGLAGIIAGAARSLGQRVCPDPLPEEPAHGLVVGNKKRGGIAGKLRDQASWILKPRKTT